MANPLARSDTLEALEPIWSNPRPSGGSTPIPPRNEPLLYIPSDDFPPKLLKLIYLASTQALLSSSSVAGAITPENDILDTSSDVSLRLLDVSMGASEPENPTRSVTETPPSHTILTTESGSVQ